MMTVTISGDDFHNINGFYKTIYSKMQLFDDWTPAHNLDALNDMLYSGFGKGPIQLIWEQSDKSQNDLGRDATIAFYQNKIDIGKPYNVKWATEKRDEIIAGTGQTLFQIIVEILESHSHIQLVLK